MSRCSRCNELSVEKIDSGEVVCTSCGLLHDDFILGESTDRNNGTFCGKTSGVFLMQGQTISKAIKNACCHRSTYIKRRCLEIIKKLVAECKLGNNMYADIESEFLKVYERYKQRGISFKILLAGSCVYSFLLSTSATFSVTRFCKSINCKPKKLYSVYHEVKSHLNTNAKPCVLEKEVHDVLINVPRRNLQERKEYCELVKKTIQVTQFVADCWLVTGRSLKASIIASSYFAWKSLDLTRLKCSFVYFCDMCKFEEKTDTAVRRIREMNTLFIKLAKCLPYVDEKTLNKTTIVGYLDDIMKYRNLVTDDLCSSEEANGDKDVTDDREREKFNKFRISQTCSTVCEDITDDELESSTSVDCPDEEIIPDSDWHMYLRSEDEVRSISKLISSSTP